MKSPWIGGVPLMVLLLLAPAPAPAAEIRDAAGMFDPGVVRRAAADLERIERQYQVPITIETVPSLDGQKINDAAVRRDRQLGNRGIYVLMAKQDHKISNLLIPGTLKNHLTERRLLAARDAFTAEFRKGDFNNGLNQGIRAIEDMLTAARAEAGRPLGAAAPPGARGGRLPAARAPGGAAPVAQGGGGSGFGTLLVIGLIIIAVLIGVRLLGRLFSGGGAPRGYPGSAPMGGPGGHGGYGGYGGGGGGGFFSSLFGGIGGALAGNWLYDQFSGRHHGSEGGYHGGSAYDHGASPPVDAGADEIVGADYGGGQGGDWGGGDAGGGDDWGGGGGDWGGGDGGGGGDW